MENITFEENGALVPRDENPKCIVSPYGKNVLFSHGVAFRNDYTESVFSGKKIPPPGGASFILLAFGLLRSRVTAAETGGTLRSVSSRAITAELTRPNLSARFGRRTCTRAYIERIGLTRSVHGRADCWKSILGMERTTPDDQYTNVLTVTRGQNWRLNKRAAL